MLICVENCGPNYTSKRVPWAWCQKIFKFTFKFTIKPKSYTAMLLYLFFDSSLSSCPKKMETEKWPKAADSPLLYIWYLLSVWKKCLKYEDIKFVPYSLEFRSVLRWEAEKHEQKGSGKDKWKRVAIYSAQDTWSVDGCSLCVYTYTLLTEILEIKLNFMWKNITIVLSLYRK